MRKTFKWMLAALVAVLAVSSLTACSNSSTIDMKSVSSVIDVRTPEEFATGHLQGALNLNIEGSTFASDIDALDHEANYVLYCRSGNRAGQALAFMSQNGFTGTITNAGAVADASSLTGLPIVQ
jgi:phage shock protein E